jgi:hypothetical protein
MGFIIWTPSLLRFEALVHLQEWNNALHIPEVICGWLSLDLPVHGVFEEDCANNPFTGKAGAGYHARPHLMHEIKHLTVVVPGVVLDAVQGQRVRGGAAALIQSRYPTAINADEFFRSVPGVRVPGFEQALHDSKNHCG